MPRRVALIVGVQKYDDPVIRPLQCSARDATALAGFLEHRGGFDVAEPLIDPASDEEVTGVNRLDTYIVLTVAIF